MRRLHRKSTIDIVPGYVLAFLCIFAVPLQLANGQDTSSTDSSTAEVGDSDYEPFSGPISEDSTALVALDDAPVTSPRAIGLAGAIGPVADDIEAIYFNPAGIGGFGWDGANPPALRKLYFPFAGVAANSNATKLNSDFGKEDGARDASIGSAIVDAHSGNRQYGRVSLGLGAIIKRTAIVPFHDQQMAAIAQGGGTDLVDLRHRSVSGIAWGTSIADPSASAFSIGVGGQYASVEQVEGEFAYLDLVNRDARTDAIKDHTYKFSGHALNVGLLWRFSKEAGTTLSVAARNAGNTRYTAAKPEEYDDLVIKEDLAVGFAMAPKLGRSGRLKWIIEATRLSDDEVTLRKKLKTGLEYLLGGGPGSYATFGVRTGYNSAGISAGLSLNLGILTLEAASQAEDIGLSNDRVIERRNVGAVTVNVADF